MKKDRLRDDSQQIHNLDELIEARNPGSLHISRDTDSLGPDLDVAKDTDVEQALTFPHPHRKKPDEIDLMDTPHEENMDEDWADQDILPSDYAHGYSEATTTDPRDDSDEIAEDKVHTMDHLALDQLSGEVPTEFMPDNFVPDEES